MLEFKDNFSEQAALYARYRPEYPEGLYEYLVALCERRALAWDCGTGNGQVAVGLARYFDNVVATDASEEQIKHAMPAANVVYSVEAAENTSLLAASVDMVTVGNAVHWFDLDRFYDEVKRVLRPGGVIAVWCYVNPMVNEEIDIVINHFHDVVLGAYWQAENRIVEKEYATLAFPFEETETRIFYASKEFSQEDMVCFLGTWSATQRYIKANGEDPTVVVGTELGRLWGNEVRTVRWKVVCRMGRNGGE